MSQQSPGNQEMNKSADRKATTRRGFAGMDPAKQRQIASEGGKAAHASGNAHQFNSAEAREAGRKGGLAGRRASGPAAE